MSLTSPEYLAFLILLFLLFWLVLRWRIAAVLLVVAANIFFYGRWGWVYLFAVPAAATIDYLIGMQLGRSKSGALRRLAVGVSILMNVGLIVGTKLPSSEVPFTLPLSLSFYAFQAMTYTIDIFRGDAKPARNFFEYFASVTFFPTTLAGPITRVSTLVAQWAKLKAALAPEDGGRALFWIGLGFTKKFLIADYLGENLVNRVFDTPALYSGFEVLAGCYGYAFQLYYDFSGYTDIALGSALLLGLKLPANFNRPYEAPNLAEFWRRWHISLSNWLRDYLYFSFPGLRTLVMPFIALTITMVLGGIWHGLTWNFLIWGSLHGLGLAMHRAWQTARGTSKPSSRAVVRFLTGVVTFHFVVAAWVFFRAESLDGALLVLQQAVSGTVGFANITPSFAMVMGIAVLFHYLPKDWYSKTVKLYSSAPAIAQAAMLAALAISIQYIAATGSAPFVYQKF